MKVKEVPLVENLDQAHCQQACVKMALNYFLPNNNYSDAEIDEGTAQTGGPTWFPPAVMFLDQEELSVQLFSQSEIDYRKFSNNLKEYIRSKISQREFQIESLKGAFENTTAVQDAARKMVEKGLVNYERELDIEKISKMLVSPSILAIGKTYYPWLTGKLVKEASHYVLIIQSNDKTTWEIHDPGPPVKANLIVGKKIQGNPMFSEVLLVSKKN